MQSAVTSDEVAMEELQTQVLEVQGMLEERTHQLHCMLDELRESQRQALSLKLQLEQCSIDKETAQAALEAERDQNGNQCVICLERPASHVFIPCGHLALCDQCQPGDRCPVC